MAQPDHDTIQRWLDDPEAIIHDLTTRSQDPGVPESIRQALRDPETVDQLRQLLQDPENRQAWVKRSLQGFAELDRHLKAQDN